jgi:hypothetical protein
MPDTEARDLCLTAGVVGERSIHSEVVGELTVESMEVRMPV